MSGKFFAKLFILFVTYLFVCAIIYFVSYFSLVKKIFIDMPAFRAVQKSLYYGPYLEVWQNKHDCVTYDEELIYVPKIGACRHKNAEFDTTLNFTKNGRLMPKIKNKNTKPIIVLGDSHAMGWGVNDNKTFSYVLQNLSKTPVYNLAVSSYGTVREVIRLEKSGLLEKSDIILYSDPDADRLGLIVKVSKEERKYFGKWKFIKANDIWTLILWYILKNIFNFNSSLIYREKLFIVKSYITSDSLNAVAQKFGIQCLNGNVGFSDLSNIVREKWKEGKINVGMFEESNGIGIAGNPKIDSNIPSHILEKDAALAATLIAEISAYAKSEKTTILKLLDHLYVDPEIGYYATFRLDLPEN